MSTTLRANAWLIAFAVVVPTFMEVLDTTVANVALRYIAGGLSAAQTDSEWVITSYLAANAIILPISGWLSAHLGRRRYFLWSIAIFTTASVLCGLSVNLGMLIACRVLQGLAGGGLQPSSQAILLDSFPAEKQGAAQTLFGIAALIAPVLGPTLGGYITDQYSWRWIFYINLPVGALAYFLCAALVRDPAYLQEEREKLKRQTFGFDTIGLGLLVVMLVSWEILLSKGQDAGRALRRRFVGVDLVGDTPGAAGGELPAFGRAQFRVVLRGDFLFLCRAVRIEHAAAGDVGITLRLRCFPRRSRTLALGHIYHCSHHRGGAFAWIRSRRPLVDRRRVARPGFGQLVDVAP
jgi:MFS family permease